VRFRGTSVSAVVLVAVEAEPAEVGMAAGRLARIDRHLAAYVDDGRLAGWTVLVARRGRVVHLTSYGQCDLQAGLPVETDTLWRVYSMTKPVTSVAAMSLFEEGAFALVSASASAWSSTRARARCCRRRVSTPGAVLASTAF